MLPTIAHGVAPAPSAAPVPRASSYVLVDAASGEVLASRGATVRHPMASTTKMMTALLAIETGDLARTLTVPATATSIGESTAGLVAGERIALGDLLTGLLVGSGNDAAIAIATGLGPGQPAFVARMNRRAVTLGLRDTHFANPHGLDAPSHYSSARDLVTLATALMAQPPARAIVASRRATIPGPNSTGRRKLVSENTLLSIDREADGVKTGHTAGAGYAMVAHARRPRTATALYLALIGEPSLDARAQDAKRLLRWGFAQYGRPTVIRANVSVARAAIRDRPGVFVDLGVLHPLAATVRVGRPLSAVIVALPEVRGPVTRGQQFGVVELRSGERTVARAPLTALRDAAGPDITDRAGAAVGNLLP